MRGGLGRILLTAFMLLAIGPLGILSYLATRRVQIDTRQAAVGNLQGVVETKASLLDAWLDAHQQSLALLAEDAALRLAAEQARWDDACAILRERSHVWGDWSVVLSAPMAGTCDPTAYACAEENWMAICSSTDTIDRSREGVFSGLGLDAFVLEQNARNVSASHTTGLLTAYPRLAALERLMQVGENGPELHVYLFAPRSSPETPGSSLVLADVETCPVTTVPPFLYESGLVTDTAQEHTSVPGEDALSGAGFYQDGAGSPIVGAYRWLEPWEIGLWAEQPRVAVEAREDELAAVLVGSTLAVALLTAVLAAVVTRQVTQPIVQLTMSAVKIAAGDLSQKVELEQRDEIGVLARAFNVMMAELRSLYDGLEGKVAERTQQLTQANRELRYKAMQLKLSAEVGRIATSILDLDLLQQRVTALVLEAYAHAYGVDYVAIWLCDEFGEWLERQAYSGLEKTGAACRVAVGDGHPLGQAAADGQLRILNPNEQDRKEYVLLIIPLHIGKRALGSLEMHCTQFGAIGEDEVEMLQGLGNQISVAIENARLYALEHEAVERLSRLDHLRLASLGVGSRELATELNTIIGFSRLILKEIDGPLTDLQRADLGAIYKSGYRLLGLIDHVITLSELESEQVELDRQAVDWETLLDEVGVTAEQRLVDIELVRTREQVLPPVKADAALLRRAILALVSAVAEQSEQGRVKLAVMAGYSFFQEGSPVKDGIPDEVRIGAADGEEGMRRICHREYGQATQGENGPAMGEEIDQISVGLALAQQIAMLHGGRMWLDFDAEGRMSGMIALPAAGGTDVCPGDPGTDKETGL